MQSGDNRAAGLCGFFEHDDFHASGSAAEPSCVRLTAADNAEPHRIILWLGPHFNSTSKVSCMVNFSRRRTRDVGFVGHHRKLGEEFMFQSDQRFSTTGRDDDFDLDVCRFPEYPRPAGAAVALDRKQRVAVGADFVQQPFQRFAGELRR